MNKGREMEESLKTKLIGSWVLKSFVIEDPQQVMEPWGDNARGLLIYTASGTMSVSINKEIEKSLDNKAEDIFDSILFYAGTYEIHGQTICHTVDHASDPARIGKQLVRFASFDRNQLILATPQESFGRAILTWQKI